ncbi:MAG: nucleotidyltransferase family protein, partial [Clostridia bacterium]|nr:nucleotidyltransferase family protein [Clostridia bacterium]
MPIYQKTLSFLASALRDEPPPFDGSALTEQEWVDILLPAKKMGFAHVIMGKALKSGWFKGSFKTKAETFFAGTLYAFEKMRGELALLTDAFSQNGIPYIPLKGAVLAEVYPEPYMCLSGDIDVLVKPEDVDKAVDLLKASYGYTFVQR